MSDHKSTICLLFHSNPLILAQTRAIQPVRIEATVAQDESISQIYKESYALIIGVSDYTNG